MKRILLVLIAILSLSVVSAQTFNLLKKKFCKNINTLAIKPLRTINAPHATKQKIYPSSSIRYRNNTIVEKLNFDIFGNTVRDEQEYDIDVFAFDQTGKYLITEKNYDRTGWNGESILRYDFLDTQFDANGVRIGIKGIDYQNARFDSEGRVLHIEDKGEVEFEEQWEYVTDVTWADGEFTSMHYTSKDNEGDMEFDITNISVEFNFSRFNPMSLDPIAELTDNDYPVFFNADVHSIIKTDDNTYANDSYIRTTVEPSGRKATCEYYTMDNGQKMVTFREIVEYIDNNDSYVLTSETYMDETGTMEVSKYTYYFNEYGDLIKEIESMGDNDISTIQYDRSYTSQGKPTVTAAYYVRPGSENYEYYTEYYDGYNPSSIYSTRFGENVNVWYNNGCLHIETPEGKANEAKIYSIDGKLLYSLFDEETAYPITMPGHGVMIVKVKYNHSEIIRKISY